MISLLWDSYVESQLALQLLEVILVHENLAILEVNVQLVWLFFTLRQSLRILELNLNVHRSGIDPGCVVVDDLHCLVITLVEGRVNGNVYDFFDGQLSVVVLIVFAG